MTHLPLPRLRAGTALALTCLLMAAPLSAQESPSGAQPAPEPAAQPETAAPAPQNAASETAPAQTTAQQDSASQPATAATTTEAPAAAPQQTAPAAIAPAPAENAPAATVPAETQPTEPAATAVTPVAESATAPETAAPAGSGILPQSVQDALAPVLNPPARDPNLPHDLSPMGMFLAADWVVKGVMIGLAFASIVTWTVLVAKMLELLGAMRRAQSGIRRIEGAASLTAAQSAVGNRRDPVSQMIRAAAVEYDRSAAALDQAGDTGLKERVDSYLERIEAIASRRMSRGTGVLATIGSTAPFVGLFGTVWGIMNSFIGISRAQTTNLAVVAPGIAEALLATAIGLVAAIPAVVIYNVFARAITGYRLRLGNAGAGVRRLLSRDLDFRGTTSRTEV
ncbi:tonB-system energizer ExbB [Paracoccus kondratievae]|uniref:tonB-system energizer ExbB n=1 Tax=Paracoccus kondratievae TaxID=135740 RepID=UPI0012668699|nr:tonB-system energizer ExbB [Paracoccus kondratievae]QFQ87593.1 tonB-system energizer ExbB [Paracoccus kondratievae]